MSGLSIKELGSPVLRQKSESILNITPDIVQTIEGMVQLLNSTANGAALAAPQVGVLKRIVVVDSGDGIIELINPEIVAIAGEQIGPEGCLSIPGVWGVVKRADYVKVQALSRTGQNFIMEGKGFMARCLQHEIDHLEGILFIDIVEQGQIYKEQTNEPFNIEVLNEK